MKTSLPIDLPIDPYLNSITTKILSDVPVILSASPGTGKTTRVPFALLETLKSKKNLKKIIVLVPKRISALSAAARVCEENNIMIGTDVGYMVRFESKVTNKTQLIFMTDGLFLKKCNDESFIQSVGYLFLDEFHERKSNMDLALGLMFERKILNENLQIIVMSASMNTNQLSNYFKNFELIDIQAPPYKVNKIYSEIHQRLQCDASFYENLRLTTQKAWMTAKKDILIFLPGLREIMKASEVLKPCFPQIRIELLHGGLDLDSQRKIVKKQGFERRIILATNIAESSVTLTDLDCVIDSGLEKNIEYESKIGFSKLITERISAFSSLQREGRSSRTSDGFCFKLWHLIDERSQPLTIKPQVLNSPLESELIILAQAGVSDFHQFSWLDQPKTYQINNAENNLKKWNILNSKCELTCFGQAITKSMIGIKNSILFIELVCNAYFNSHKNTVSSAAVINDLADLFSRLEDINLKNQNGRHTTTNIKNRDNDLQRILELPVTPNQIQLKKALISYAEYIYALKLSIHSCQLSLADDLPTQFFKIYAFYFKNHIIAKKTGILGLSSAGRGTELSAESKSSHYDFYAALSGYEKNDTTTIINYAVGVQKTEAIKILAANTAYTENILFDNQQETFFKQETLYFGSFKLNEKSKFKLSPSDLTSDWKKYILNSPRIFLNLNITYLKITEHIQFIKNKQAELNLKTTDFEFIEFFDLELVHKLLNINENFNDFKNTDIMYLIKEQLPNVIYEILNEIPRTIKMASGKIIEINYTDPKAPMISAKIQDFFGWNHQPKILAGRLTLTLQLLAPNMRPTQITSHLPDFWKNSYLDIRKDLRARYPKHPWPEDPTTFVRI